MNHSFQDAVSLELARRIAAQLPQHPEWLDLARQNIERWSQRNSSVPSLLRCYSEWNDILMKPIEEIRAILMAENGDGQRLRQNSPFAGVLSPAEVWEIKSRLRDRNLA